MSRFPPGSPDQRLMERVERAMRLSHSVCRSLDEALDALNGRTQVVRSETTRLLDDTLAELTKWLKQGDDRA